MAVQYHTEDCRYRLPEKRRTAAWLRAVADRRGARTVSGDIFIDVGTVADNARIYGAPRLTEMRRVVVHGLLHLCGQKDKTPRTNAQMHRKEDKYLKFWEEER